MYLIYANFIKMDKPTLEMLTRICDTINDNFSRNIVKNSDVDIKYLIEQFYLQY